MGPAIRLTDMDRTRNRAIEFLSFTFTSIGQEINYINKNNTVLSKMQSFNSRYEFELRKYVSGYIWRQKNKNFQQRNIFKVSCYVTRGNY